MNAFEVVGEGGACTPFLHEGATDVSSVIALEAGENVALEPITVEQSECD